jgi:hypothetical protein
MDISTLRNILATFPLPPDHQPDIFKTADAKETDEYPSFEELLGQPPSEIDFLELVRRLNKFN